MKNLSIEQKAKAYDEVIEKANVLYKTAEPMSGCNVILETLFPKLKESEDEKIRKELLEHCRNTRCVTEEGAEKIVKWIAWLEKQGEQEKPQVYKTDDCEVITYSETDGYKVVEPKFKVGDWVVVSTAEADRVVQIASIEYFKDGHPSYFTTEGRWFGNGTKARLLTDKDVETITLPESEFIVKQKPAWSKDDEMIALSIEQVMNCASLLNIVPEKIDKIRTWLNSLKDRFTWKPSEEQLDALKRTQTGVIQFSVLQNLYNDLKKLSQS